MNYYNEHDPRAAAWLVELIRGGHIAPGIVDERGINDVRPGDLAGFTQCHFFAGIGVWSYALRLAGWPDDRPVWTGSCPCQPFSNAGSRAGFDDERHLWPAWFQLIAQCRPATVFGEQVASKDGLGWFDLVHTDLEAAGYAVGAADLCAAGVGAPHIRQRLWFVADADAARLEGRDAGSLGRQRAAAERGGGAGRLAGANGDRLGALAQPGLHDPEPDAEPRGGAGGLADADGGHPGTEREQRGGEQRLVAADGGALPGRPGPTNGHWSAADWILCRDAKWRPVEAGTFPLAHGAAERVGRLRGYGNGLVATAAEAFIASYLGSLT